MYTIAICYSDISVLKTFSLLLKNYANIGKYQLHINYYLNSEMLIGDMVDGEYYDIIYIDIDMPHLNRQEIIKKLKTIQPSCLIIILTFYPQNAIEIINSDWFRCLIGENWTDKFYDNLNAALKEISITKQTYYCISTPRKHIKINCQNIIYCYKDSKMSIIVTNSMMYKERKSLQQLLNDLNEKCNLFVKPERGYIVNLQYVKCIKKNELLLDNNIYLPIGKKYSHDLIQEIEKYWRIYETSNL